MQKTQSMSKVQRLTLLGLMTALVVVLQLLGSFIRFGMFSVSLVLIPIVVGAALAGPLAGGWLGLVFGVTVLLSGDAAFFLGMNYPGTIITVLAKGIAAGLLAGLVFQLLQKKDMWLAVLVAAVVCPVVNTGVFLVGCYLFFFSDLSAIASAAGRGLFTYLILFMVGGNFLFELLFNLVLSPVILKITQIGINIFPRWKYAD